MDALRKRKHLVLLFALILTLGIEPLAPEYSFALIVYEILFTALVFTVFLIVFERRWERFVALVVVVAAFACNVARYSFSGGSHWAVLVVFHALVVGFLSFAVLVILRGIFEHARIGADDVLGACCGYIFAGVAWGNLYTLVEVLAPGSFSVRDEIAMQFTDIHRRRFIFNYFSLTTLATLGYGDIVPVRPISMTLIWLEAIFGQFYVAVVVAQLVGLRLA